MPKALKTSCRIRMKANYGLVHELENEKRQEIKALI